MPAAPKERSAISVATDCSGMETPIMALRRLRCGVNHLFSCDISKPVKATIMANYPPKVWYDDLTQRDHSRAAKADLYVAGFPCQPFSMAGKMQGFNDLKGRGVIFFHILEYIRERQPKVFVLENVSGLMRINRGEYFAAIVKCLEELGTYNVHHALMNTKDHGLPQNRPRVYIVGISKRLDRGTFEWPSALPPAPIEDFLDATRSRHWRDALPPDSQGTAKANVRRFLKEIQAAGSDPYKEAWVIDCDSSGPKPGEPHGRAKAMRGLTPCFTCSRSGGHWITNRGRRMTKNEMMRLQGMPTPEEGFKVASTDGQLGKMVGNAMSCNVLERIFCRLLPAAGLADAADLKDRWEAAARKRKGASVTEAAAAEGNSPKRLRRMTSDC